MYNRKPTKMCDGNSVREYESYSRCYCLTLCLCCLLLYRALEPIKL